MSKSSDNTNGKKLIAFLKISGEMVGGYMSGDSRPSNCAHKGYADGGPIPIKAEGICQMYGLDHSMRLCDYPLIKIESDKAQNKMIVTHPLETRKTK